MQQKKERLKTWTCFYSLVCTLYLSIAIGHSNDCDDDDDDDLTIKK